MNAVTLNFNTMALTLVPISFFIFALIKHYKSVTNSIMWTWLFHSAVIAEILFRYLLPGKPHLEQGAHICAVSLFLTIVIFLVMDNCTSKKIKTIWKLPVVGSLVGLYLPLFWGQWLATFIILFALGILFKYKKTHYLVLKPALALTLFYLLYHASLIIGWSEIFTALFGLISYVCAVKIMNMAIIKEWANSFENN